MKQIKTIALAMLILAPLLQADNPKHLFEQNCKSCHAITKPKNKNEVIAPTIMGVMKHIKVEFNSKEKAVEFISDYVLNPTKQKAICQPEKLEKFGLMPSLKGVISKDELKRLSFWYTTPNYPYNYF